MLALALLALGGRLQQVVVAMVAVAGWGLRELLRQLQLLLPQKLLQQECLRRRQRRMEAHLRVVLAAGVAGVAGVVGVVGELLPQPLLQPQLPQQQLVMEGGAVGMPLPPLPCLLSLRPLRALSHSPLVHTQLPLGQWPLLLLLPQLLLLLLLLQQLQHLLLGAVVGVAGSTRPLLQLPLQPQLPRKLPLLLLPLPQRPPLPQLQLLLPAMLGALAFAALLWGSPRWLQWRWPSLPLPSLLQAQSLPQPLYLMVLTLAARAALQTRRLLPLALVLA